MILHKICNVVITVIVFAGIGFNQCLGVILPSETNQQAPQWSAETIAVYEEAYTQSLENGALEDGHERINQSIQRVQLPLDDSQMSARLLLELSSWCGANLTKALLQALKNDRDILEEWLARECHVGCNLDPLDPARLDSAYETSVLGVSYLEPNNKRVNLFEFIAACPVTSDNASNIIRAMYNLSRTGFKETAVRHAYTLTNIGDETKYAPSNASYASSNASEIPADGESEEIIIS